MVPGVGTGGGNGSEGNGPGRWAGGVTSEPGITWSPPSLFSQLCHSHPQFFSLRWNSPIIKHTLTKRTVLWFLVCSRLVAVTTV